MSAWPKKSLDWLAIAIAETKRLGQIHRSFVLKNQCGALHCREWHILKPADRCRLHHDPLRLQANHSSTTQAVDEQSFHMPLYPENVKTNLCHHDPPPMHPGADH